MSVPPPRLQWIPLVAALWLASLLGAWWFGAQGNGPPATPAGGLAAPQVAALQNQDPTLALRGWPGIPAGGLRQAQEAQRAVENLRALFTEPCTVARERRYLELLGRLTAADMPACDAELTALEASGQNLPSARIMFWLQWAELCPASALNYAAADPGRRRHGMETVLTTWAATNARGALLWLKEHSRLPQWPDLLRGIITGVARRDMHQAAGLALEVAGEHSQTAPALFASVAEQAIDTGHLEDATALLHDFAASGAPPWAVTALAEGIRTSLRHRGAPQLAAWESSQAGAGWQQTAARSVPTTTPP